MGSGACNGLSVRGPNIKTNRMDEVKGLNSRKSLKWWSTVLLALADAFDMVSISFSPEFECYDVANVIYWFEVTWQTHVSKLEWVDSFRRISRTFSRLEYLEVVCFVPNNIIAMQIIGHVEVISFNLKFTEFTADLTHIIYLPHLLLMVVSTWVTQH